MARQRQWLGAVPFAFALADVAIIASNYAGDSVCCAAQSKCLDWGCPSRYGEWPGIYRRRAWPSLSGTVI